MGDLRDVPEGEPVYLRDLDGTGSMHVCSEGDPGAVEYVPAPKSVAGAARVLLETIEKHGDWDDGCFYYCGTSASELQSPMATLRRALASPEGE